MVTQSFVSTDTQLLGFRKVTGAKYRIFRWIATGANFLQRITKNEL